MQRTAQLAMIPILVTDQEEALAFYTEKLGLEKRCDISFGPGLRLLTVAARDQSKPEIALAQPSASLPVEARMGSRGRQMNEWVFRTDDCQHMYTILQARGVRFLSSPTLRSYGLEAIFTDPFGNTFTLLELSPEAHDLLHDYTLGTAA